MKMNHSRPGGLQVTTEPPAASKQALTGCHRKAGHFQVVNLPFNGPGKHQYGDFGIGTTQIIGQLLDERLGAALTKGVVNVDDFDQANQLAFLFHVFRVV